MRKFSSLSKFQWHNSIINYSHYILVYILRPYSFYSWKSIPLYLSLSLSSVGICHCSFPKFCPCIWLFVTQWTAAYPASQYFTISQSLLKYMSIKLLMLSNHLIIWYPLLLLPSIFLSIRVFSNESSLRIRWPKYWNFSFSINPSNEYSELISFKIDWFSLLAVQWTL